MADTKVSDMTQIDAVASTDTVYIVDASGGTNAAKVRKATAGQLKTFVETGRFVATTTNPTASDDTDDGYVAGTTWLNTNTGTTFRARSVTANAAVWVGLDSLDHPGYISGNWYMPNWGLTLSAGSALVANTARYLPFVIKSRVTISTLGCRVTTQAASGNVQLAIYASNNATGRPTGAVLARTGNISTTSTGPLTADITGADVTLEPGLYWMAVNADATAGGTAALQTVANTGPHMSWLFGSATHATITSGNTASRTGLSASETFNTWSDVTSASFTETTNANDGILQFKVA